MGVHVKVIYRRLLHFSFPHLAPVLHNSSWSWIENIGHWRSLKRLICSYSRGRWGGLKLKINCCVEGPSYVTHRLCKRVTSLRTWHETSLASDVKRKNYVIKGRCLHDVNLIFLLLRYIAIFNPKMQQAYMYVYKRNVVKNLRKITRRYPTLQ